MVKRNDQPLRDELDEASTELPEQVIQVAERRLTKQDGRKNNGGARVGAGGPRRPHANTLEKRRVREAFEQLVLRAATKLFNAQMGLALGEQSLYVKYYVGTGKDRKAVVDVVTDPEIIKEYVIDDGLTLNRESEDEYYYIASKPADNKAIEALLNRALGKAPDKLEITGGFFSQKELTIKVVGSSHDTIDVGEDGQIIESGTDAQRTPRLSD
jgi:hypothetical protein